MRALLVSLLALAAAPALVACSPVQVGDVGVGVDVSGAPVLVMASCEGPASRIEINSTKLGDPGPEGRDWVRERSLRNPEPDYSDPAAVSLVDPDPGWETTDVPWVGFADDRIYKVSAWPQGDGTFGSVSFELEEVTELRDGEVLSSHGTVPVAEFIDESHEKCGAD